MTHSWRASPCRVADAATAAHLHYLRKEASDPSTASVAWRAETKVPPITDTTNRITLVLDSARCTAALVAFNTTAELADSAATEIELLQADSVFVAAHPAIRSGEFVMSYVFDRRFRFLGSYLQ